jgi:hypothetical protein
MLAFPIVVFVAWRILAPTARASRNLVIAVVGTFVAMTAILLVLWYEQEAPPGYGYVPARLENGRIIPGRVEPGRVETGSVELGRVQPGQAGSGHVQSGSLAEPPAAAK